MTARATEVTLQPGESITIRAAASTVPPGGTTPPEGGGGTPPVNPPVTPPAESVYLGDLTFGGAQVNSQGVSGNVVAYARIIIPNPLPAGWAGGQGHVSIFESASGTYYKKMWMSRQPFDYSVAYPAYSEGAGSANIYMTFGGDPSFAVSVQAGEEWYITVKNELPNGSPSCPPGANGNFATRLYSP